MRFQISDFRPENRRPARRRFTRIAPLVALFGLMAAPVAHGQGAAGDMSRLKLRSTAAPAGPAHLADVLSFDEADPAFLFRAGLERHRLHARQP